MYVQILETLVKTITDSEFGYPGYSIGIILSRGESKKEKVTDAFSKTFPLILYKALECDHSLETIISKSHIMWIFFK